MAYTKEHSRFFSGHTLYYKDGVLIARRNDDEPIRLLHEPPTPIEITRSQAFRYWGRHWSGKHYLCLPEVLQEAIDLDPHDTEVLVIFEDGKRQVYLR